MALVEAVPRGRAALTAQVEDVPRRRAPLAVAADVAAPLAARLLTRRTIDAMCAALVVAVLALTAIFAILRPAPSWDAIAYSALVAAQPGDAAADLHRRGFETVRAVATPARWGELTTEGAYRQRQAADPQAFASMLPMYAVKPGYVAAARALAPATGVWGAFATLNILALAALGTVALLWLGRAGALQAAPVVLLALLVLNVRELAAMATPALPAAALVVAATWALARGRLVAAGLLLVAATTFRPDTLLFAFALVLAHAATGRTLRGVAAIFAATLAAYLAVTIGTDHIGWWTHYAFSNGGYVATLEGFDPPFSLALYAQGLARGGLLSLATFDWPLVALVLVGGWAMLHRAGRVDRQTGTLLLALLLAVAGKFVTFPLPDDRIYLGFAVAAALLLAASWRPRAVG